VSSQRGELRSTRSRQHGRRLRANIGHSPTAWRTCQIDPFAALQEPPMNGREATESGLRLKVSVAPVVALPDPRDRLHSSIFSDKPSWSATLLRKTPTRKSCLRRKTVRRRSRFSACSRSPVRTSIPLQREQTRPKTNEAPLKPRTGGAFGFGKSERPRLYGSEPFTGHFRSLVDGLKLASQLSGCQRPSVSID
jgi:hypothetical protein